MACARTGRAGARGLSGTDSTEDAECALGLTCYANDVRFPVLVGDECYRNIDCPLGILCKGNDIAATPEPVKGSCVEFDVDAGTSNPDDAGT